MENPTFEQQVAETVSKMTQDESGKWQLPEEAQNNEALAFAATAERRRRDTQASYTKSQMQLKQLEAERDQLAAGWEADFVGKLPAEAQTELEELKSTDPDAWRTRINELEQQQRAKFEETRQEIATKAKGESEIDYRKRALTEFAEQNPEIKLTDDVVANDIPPRISKKLEKGEISFGQFLQDCKEYLTKGKVIGGKEDKPADLVDLGSAAGGSAPDADAQRKASVNQYKDEIY